jgi:hypothetical protein
MTEEVSATAGRKFDLDKLEYGLLPPHALDEVVHVLTLGARKYARENWRYVEDGRRRYFDAAQRHLWAYKRGELKDPETGISHLSHAVCSLLFIADLDATGQ